MNTQIETQQISEILQSARRIYEIHAERAAKEERERQDAQAKRTAAERAELHKWLATWMPEALIPFVKINDSTYTNAARYDYNSRTKGVWVEIHAPAAVPIAFRVYQSLDELSFGQWAYPSGEGTLAVPVFAAVKASDDGDIYIDYDWPNYPQYDDIEVALGHALSLYEEWWPALQESWLRLDARLHQEAEAREADVAANTPPDVPERIAQALERIAGALEAQVYGY